MSGTDGASHAVSEARPQGSGKDGPRVLMQGSARRGGSVIYLGKTGEQMGVLWRVGIEWRAGQGIHIGGKDHLRS